MALVARVANGVLVLLGGGGRPSRRYLMLYKAEDHEIL